VSNSANVQAYVCLMVYSMFLLWFLDCLHWPLRGTSPLPQRPVLAKRQSLISTDFNSV